MGPDTKTRTLIYADKARTEFAQLERDGIVMAGNAFSPILLLKGEPGVAEKDGGALLGGSDGKALRAALIKLGYAPEEWAGMATWTSSSNPIDSQLLRQAVITFDPTTLIVCDEAAAACLRDAFADDLFAVEDLSCAMLSPGYVVHLCGMRILNLGGFEAALGSDQEKQLMWARLKQIPPLGNPY